MSITYSINLYKYSTESVIQLYNEHIISFEELNKELSIRGYYDQVLSEIKRKESSDERN